MRAGAIVPLGGVERGWHCASARFEKERSGTQHGAELARITHYACTLDSVQFVCCWRRGDGRRHVCRKEKGRRSGRDEESLGWIVKRGRLIRNGKRDRGEAGGL